MPCFQYRAIRVVSRGVQLYSFGWLVLFLLGVASYLYRNAPRLRGVLACVAPRDITRDTKHSIYVPTVINSCFFAILVCFSSGPLACAIHSLVRYVIPLRGNFGNRDSPGLVA